MMEFWNALSLIQRVLFSVAVPATLLLVAECVLLLIGLANGPGDVDTDADDVDVSDMDATDVDAGDIDADMDVDGPGMDSDGIDADSDADMDADAPAHEAGDLRWFTFVGVLALLSITGWAGLALIEAMLPAVLAIAMALGLGVLAMYLCAVVMRRFRNMGESGNIAIKNAVGRFAEAYLPIPPERSGTGKVTLTLQGRFVELEAMTDDMQTIPTGTKVVVTDVADGAAVLVRAARK